MNGKYIDKYNLERLVKIEVRDFTINSWYRYKKEIKFLWFITTYEGYYGFLNTYLGVLPPTNTVLIDGRVMNLPRCTLYFNEDHEYTKTFKTYDEAKLFGNRYSEKYGKWVIDKY